MMFCRCCRSSDCPRPLPPLPPPPPASPWQGVYERQPVENDWHRGTLRLAPAPDGSLSLRWTNEAGAAWTLDAPADLSGRTSCVSRTHADCPYGEQEVPFEAGGCMRFIFCGEAYVRVGDAPGEFEGEPEAAALLESLGHRGALSSRGMEVLGAYLRIARAYKAGLFAEAQALMQALWETKPPGDELWWGAKHLYHGPNYGSPTCYYLLRMLNDVVVFKASGAAPQQQPLQYNLSIVALRGAKVRMPPTYSEWVAGDAESWPEVELALHEGFVGGLPDDAGLEAADVCHTTWAEDTPPFLRTAFYWWGEYLHAISGGRLLVNVSYHLIEHPELLECTLNRDNGRQFGGNVDINKALTGSNLPEEVLANSDALAFFYPSPVPRDGSFMQPDPDVNLEWVTGGAGRAPRGQPCFITDDLFFVRHPYHLGHGLMSSWERQTYIPQWLQHEFNHHLYNHDNLYAECRLETEKGHDWFSRDFWPTDFEGIYEADYYHEAMHKRFQLPESHPPLWYRLKTGAWTLLPGEEPTDALSTVAAEWERIAPENDWHYVTITQDGERADVFLWTNRAGASWPVVYDADTRAFCTTADCPYGVQRVLIGSGKPPLQGEGAAAEFSYGPRPVSMFFLGDEFTRVG